MRRGFAVLSPQRNDTLTLVCIALSRNEGSSQLLQVRCSYTQTMEVDLDPGQDLDLKLRMVRPHGRLAFGNVRHNSRIESWLGCL